MIDVKLIRQPFQGKRNRCNRHLNRDILAALLR